MDINGIAIKATLIVDGKEVELELGCVNEKMAKYLKRKLLKILEALNYMKR